MLDVLFLLFIRVNIIEGVHEESILMTGLHTICDINCKVCREKLGWKYVLAHVIIFVSF